MRRSNLRVVVLFAPVIIVPFLAMPLALGVDATVWMGTIGAAIVLVLAVVGYRRRSARRANLDRSDTPTGGDDTETADDVWNAIPSWDYGGRHAESGGLSRDEQERAIEDVHDQAAALEDNVDG